jgi:hypothetical protein
MKKLLSDVMKEASPMGRTGVSFIVSTVVAGFLFGGGPASAATVCLHGGFGSTNFGPDASCSTTETELTINLNEKKNSMTGSGVIEGSPAVIDFTTDVAVDFSSGNSTITPKGNGTFNSLDMTVPGFTFDDLAFHLEFNKTGTGNSEVENLTVTWGTAPGDSFTYNNLKANTDIGFFLVSPTPLTFVDLTTTTGFNEAKQFEISSVVPEPASWVMMGLGFAGLGFAGYRRARSSRTPLGA